MTTTQTILFMGILICTFPWILYLGTRLINKLLGLGLEDGAVQFCVFISFLSIIVTVYTLIARLILGLIGS